MEKKTLRSVSFVLEETPGRRVALAGTFNEWKPERFLTDRNGDGVYRARLMLAPGEYQYKFVVDGEWRLDPANPNFVPNDFGSLNSILVVKPAPEAEAPAAKAAPAARRSIRRSAARGKKKK